jgi:hypothetical protein
MLYGASPSVFFALPMLGKHPDEYPRFRDCFVGAMTRSEELDQFGIPDIAVTNEKVISVFVRVGGSNRSAYEKEIEEMRNMPNYVRDYDDSFDSTFAVFVFSVPEQWNEDFERMYVRGDGSQSISSEYLAEMKRVYPKLADKFDQLLG